MAGAGDVPLAGPRVLAVGAALQQQLPGALAVDPHVHRAVVVPVPVHLRPGLGDARLVAGGGEHVEALLRRLGGHRGGGGRQAAGKRAWEASEDRFLGWVAAVPVWEASVDMRSSPPA